MATISKLSIQVDADATGVTKGLASSITEFKKWEGIAKSTFEQTRTPLEKYSKSMQELGEVHRRGLISAQTFARGMAMARKNFFDATMDKRHKTFFEGLRSGFNSTIPLFTRLNNVMLAGAAGGAGGAAAVLTIEAIKAIASAIRGVINRVTSAFRDAKRLFDEGFITKRTLAGAEALTSAWHRMRDNTSAFILNIASRLAPTILAIGDVLSEAFGPIVRGTLNIAVVGLATGFQKLAVYATNFGSVIAGSLKLAIGYGMELFVEMRRGMEEIDARIASFLGQDFQRTPLKQWLDSLKDAREWQSSGIATMFSGLSGAAGRDLEDRIKSRSDAIESMASASKALDNKEARLAEIRPGAMQLGEAGTYSAILRAQRDAQRETQRDAAKPAQQMVEQQKIGNDILESIYEKFPVFRPAAL